MRVLLWSTHRYPSGGRVGTGLSANRLATGGSCVIHDLLAKGLAGLGHEVFYMLEGGAEEPLPQGVTLVSEPVADVDIIHHYNSLWLTPSDVELFARTLSKPWLVTCHSDPETCGVEKSLFPDKQIFVSKTLARSLGGSRYVLNGIDPLQYRYSEIKEDYFLFMSNLGAAMEKGLDIALRLSKEMGFKLVVAGASNEEKPIKKVAEMCRSAGAQCVGDVRGEAKAALFASARAFLFPTSINEAFGLVMAEALMSGTPVICSDRGACSEIISPDIGFVCSDWDQYVNAVKNIDGISRWACRNAAMEKYHYLRMAADYLKEYEKEIAAFPRAVAPTSNVKAPQSAVLLKH